MMHTRDSASTAEHSDADLCTRCGQKISDVDMRIRCQRDALREWFAR